MPGNLRHGVLVGSVEGLFLRSIVDGQPLVVVVVERVEGRTEEKDVMVKVVVNLINHKN